VCAKILFFLLLHAAAAGGFPMLVNCSCMVVSSSSMHISLFAVLNKALVHDSVFECSIIILRYMQSKIAADSNEHTGILNSTPACNGQHCHTVTVSAQP